MLLAVLHLVELRQNAKDLSSFSHAPVATPQTWLEGLARLTSPGFTTLGASRTDTNFRLITKAMF